MSWPLEEKRNVVQILSDMARDCYDDSSPLSQGNPELLKNFLNLFHKGSLQEARIVLEEMLRQKSAKGLLRPSKRLYVVSMTLSLSRTIIAQATGRIGFDENKIHILNNSAVIKSSGLSELIQNDEYAFFIGQVPHTIRNETDLVRKVRLAPGNYRNVIIMTGTSGQLSSSLSSIEKSVAAFEKRFVVTV